MEPAAWQVKALARAVAKAGGFVAVLARGDPQSRALIIVHRSGGEVRAFERLPALHSAPGWRLAAQGEHEVERFVNRQKEFDPDLWAVELDVPDPARFVALWPGPG